MGFPTLQKLTQVFKGDDRIQFLAIQTVFEGYRSNTEDKLRPNQQKYRLRIPMAHAPGDPHTRSIPEIMKVYRSGGTPWKVIIDPNGKVVYNDFHIEENEAVALIRKLMVAGQRPSSE